MLQKLNNVPSYLGPVYAIESDALTGSERALKVTAYLLLWLCDLWGVVLECRVNPAHLADFLQF